MLWACILKKMFNFSSSFLSKELQKKADLKGGIYEN